MSERRRIRFGAFEADPASGELARDGVTVPIQDLPFRLLTMLAERPGEVMSRAALTQQLWGSDTHVDATAGLNTAIAKLREALGDDAEHPRFVETVPKRGYRFIGTIEPLQEPLTEPSAEAASGRTAASFVAPASSRRIRVAAMIAAALVAVAALALPRVWAGRAPTRVAVMLFDNETGNAELDRFAQGLTDAVVEELTADERLAVIGNAAILRTARMFRDIALVRDTVDAELIIVGQVQRRDGEVLVRTHLIRAGDEAHVWFKSFTLGASREAEFQATVSAQLRDVVASKL
jgi:DNA-binding winged helix-turn-helix (wHTH) protein/TolB-like protein